MDVHIKRQQITGEGIAPVTSVMVQPTWVAQVDHGTSVDAATNGTRGTCCRVGEF